jgi:hypothetical protein
MRNLKIIRTHVMVRCKNWDRACGLYSKRKDNPTDTVAPVDDGERDRRSRRARARSRDE